MSSFPLSGTVTKCLLVVAPAYAQDRELLHYIKYKLYDDGFIVVREEYRLLNPELAQQLSAGLDAMVLGAPVQGAQSANVPMPATSDLIGTAYLYVLAHRDCHPALGAFMTQLAFDDAAYSALAHQAAAVQATTTTTTTTPLWMNRTSQGAKKAVALLFPQMLSEDVPTAVESREYVQACLKSALLPALTDLAKEKPENPMQWLADRLLATNKQAPPMVSAMPE